MRLSSSFLSIPSHVLLLLPSLSIVHSQDLEWPYNLPAHVKYYPEDEVVVKRDAGILQRMQQQPIRGVKKMSPDPGQKFYPDYWSFEAEYAEETTEVWRNATFFCDLSAPFPLHSEQTSQASGLLGKYFRVSRSAREIFGKRDFVCPAGTSSCASINRPSTCCPNDQTCQIVPDTGLGDVGCCDASQICAGSLSNCPSGYTSCPNNPGGGCCLPGYACYEEGCVLTSTTVVVITPSTSSQVSSTTPPSTIITTATVIVTPIVSSASAVTSTTSVAPVTSSTTTETITSSPTTTSSNTLVCSAGFRSCPASLGGGCCPTDRACGRDFCPEMTSSASLSVPVRPTTNTVTTPSTSRTSSQSSSVSLCPTGFYACSAYYQGGCCQIGRDCASTSCPTLASTTVINSNGVTAVAPTGTYLAGQSTFLTGSCATGWFSCASSNGGGCCPSGYACGTAVCSPTANGGQGYEVGKIAPNASTGTACTTSTIKFVFSILAICMAIMVEI